MKIIRASNKHFFWFFFLFACVLLANPAQGKLVAYYPFDGDVNDYSGHGKNGVYWIAGSSTSTPTFAGGKVGQAICLHAFSSYGTDGVGITRAEEGVILPDESYFDFTNAITITAWVKFNSMMAAYPNGWFAALVTKSRASDQWSLQSNWNTGAQRLAWRIGHISGVTSTMSVRPGTTDDIRHLAMDEDHNPIWDTWYHIVTTYSSEDGWVKIYLNGQYDIGLQQTAADRLIADRNNIQAAAAIGIYAKSDYTPWGTGDSYSDSHDGLIDEVAIFDQAFSAEEVEKIYTEGPLYYGMTCMPGDISGPGGVPDCYVDLYDVVVLAENWLEGPGVSYLAGDISGSEGLPDDYVNLYDLAVMAENWLIAAAAEVPTTFDRRFDVFTFQCTPDYSDPHGCQAQFDALNWVSANGHMIMMGSDAHRAELVANGNVLGAYYNTLTSLYGSYDGSQAADQIEAYIIDRFTDTGVAPTWVSLNEISPSLWPNSEDYRAWLRECVARLHNYYGREVILFSPFPNPAYHADDWVPLSNDCYIGLEKFLSGAAVNASGNSVSWCQSQYQSSKNSYLGLGVSASRLFLTEYFSQSVSGTNWGRSGVSYADWDAAINARSQAAHNVGFAGFISYAWIHNAMLVSEADMVHFEETYRANTLP